MSPSSHRRSNQPESGPGLLYRSHSTEPTRPTVDIRHTLFEAHTQRVQLSDKQKRKHAYESLKDVLPDSSFVMIAKAEFGSEELEEVIVEMAEDPVLAGITHKQLHTADIEAIEKETIGQSGNENWKLYQKGKITASIIY